jgi:nucleoside-diphosphate-sugar epimerase
MIKGITNGIVVCGTGTIGSAVVQALSKRHEVITLRKSSGLLKI